MAEWSDTAVETIEKVVVGIREKAVVPAERASRMIVFGLFVTILLLTALTLLLVGLHRLLDVGLPIWATWFVEGIILAIAGYFVWRQRSRFAQGDADA
jgi:positive regulator of sigma E activity